MPPIPNASSAGPIHARRCWPSPRCASSMSRARASTTWRPGTRARVQVCNAGGVQDEAMAQFALARLIAMNCNFFRYHDQQKRRLWRTHDVARSTGGALTVVGLGRIGRACARLAHRLGMTVYGVRARPAPADGVAEDRGAGGAARRAGEIGLGDRRHAAHRAHARPDRRPRHRRHEAGRHAPQHVARRRGGRGRADGGPGLGPCARRLPGCVRRRAAASRPFRFGAWKTRTSRPMWAA